jgi:adenylate kinase family enzyme
MDSTLPIIEHYKARGKVREIHADRSPDEVYQDVRPLFVDL